MLEHVDETCYNPDVNMPSMMNLAEKNPSELVFAGWGPIELFEQGGLLMWPLLGLSILTFILIFTCLWTTRKSAVMPYDLVESAEMHIRKKNYAEIMVACKHDGSCLALTIHAMMHFLQRNNTANIEELREVTSSEGSRQSSRLTRQITWLSDIASIAPMIGLLGTVVGMMTTFAEMASGNFEGVKQMQMASGIAVALITTASGLIPAIVSMAAYYYFRNRIQKLISEMEVASTHLLSVISVQMDREQRLGASVHIGASTREIL